MGNLPQAIDDTLVTVLMGGFFSILGVVVGWFLNEISAKYRAKPKLCFKTTSTPDDELIEKEMRTKTEMSEYSIEIYNIGQSPFLLQNFSLYHNKKLLIDCHVVENERTILPYQRMSYTLMEQEANTLERHCRKLKFKDCKVWAYDIEGKRIKTTLDVSWIALRASFRR